MLLIYRSNNCLEREKETNKWGSGRLKPKEQTKNIPSHDMEFGTDFLDVTSKAEAEREKRDKLDFMKT